METLLNALYLFYACVYERTADIKAEMAKSKEEFSAPSKGKHENGGAAFKRDMAYI
jgi:hypothetical protein